MQCCKLALATLFVASATLAEDVDCVVSGWSDDASTQCTVSCGGGFKKQTRSVTTYASGAGAACPAALNRQVKCNEMPCPQDCLVTPWGEWSTCTKSCGGGTHLRTRQLAVEAKHGGKSCPALNQEEVCRTEVCPTAVACELSPWGAWSGCTKACKGTDGVLGVQMRKRTIAAEGTGDNACDRSALTETRTCGETPCKPVDCVLGAYGEWSKCSTTCGGGTQVRVKAVVTQALEGGTCDPEQAKESRACSEDPCPVEPDMKIEDAAVLTNAGTDDHMDKIVYADSDNVYSGGNRLYKLNKADLKVLGSYDPAPLTELTALAGDDEFLFVAGKGEMDVFEVHKVSKADLTKVGSYTVSVSSAAKGSVIAMQLDTTHVFLSLAGNDAGAIIALDKADMSQRGDVRELSAQANALGLADDHLYVGTWATPAWVYVLSAVDLTVMQQRRLDSEKHGKLVSVAVDTTSTAQGGVYFGTDAEPSYLVHLGRKLEVLGEKELDHTLGRCVSMTSDWGYVHCGTTATPGAVLKVKKADLSLVEKLDLTAEQSVFYALAHDDDGNLFAPTWSPDSAASQVLKLSGYMSPTQCTVGPWSAPSDCVDFYTRAPKNCGQGVKIQQREVHEHAKWGGARCPTLIKTEVCNAVQSECCRGGSVWSKISWHHDCSTGLTTSTTEASADCRCPEARPMTIGTGDKRTCVEAAKCHARTCDHVACQFLQDDHHHNKIKVTHSNAIHNEVNHRCSYSMARNGGCHCICWQPQCTTDADCHDGTVCGANAHCQPAR